MTTHHGFRVSALLGRAVVSDTFEVRQAAIDCAQTLERMGMCGIVVRELRFNGGDEEFTPEIEWQLHVVRAAECATAGKPQEMGA